MFLEHLKNISEPSDEEETNEESRLMPDNREKDNNTDNREEERSRVAFAEVQQGNV